MKRLLLTFAKKSALVMTRSLGYRQSENSLIEQSSQFWDRTNDSSFASNSHWCGEDAISESAWLELGKQHVVLFERFLRSKEWGVPLGRVVEWGCGGGANAIHFAKLADEFIGVEVSQASLLQCERVLREAGLKNFHPVLVPLANPEEALARISKPCDFFLCTYVFELVPSPEYGRRLIALAFQMLRPGGCAMIQIKYSTSDVRTKSRAWGYRFHAANMTTYAIDEFWELTEQAGFEPLAVTLKPRQELIGDERYAYFFLRRPADSTH